MITTRTTKNERLINQTFTTQPDLICLSHLRWDFIYQRPHQVMRRFAGERRVFYVEEPLFDNGPKRLNIRVAEANILVVTPYLPRSLNAAEVVSAQESMMNDLMATYAIRRPILWYYTPLAFAFTQHIKSLVVVYDCMNELSLFKGDAAIIHHWEASLFKRADLIFNGRAGVADNRYAYYPQLYLFPPNEAALTGETRQFAERPLAAPAYGYLRKTGP
jgi:hypothetical protein